MAVYLRFPEETGRRDAPRLSNAGVGMSEALERANREFRAGNRAAAWVLARAAVAQVPDGAYAYNLLGALAYGEGSAEATTLLERAVRLAPGNDGLVSNLAAALLERGRLVEAERTLIRLAALSPADASIDARRAGIRQRMGDVFSSWRSQRRAALLAPLSPLDAGNCGVCALSAGRADDALAAFRRLAALSPEDAGAWTQSGIGALTLGDPDRAETAFARSLAIDPVQADAAAGIRRCRRYRAARAMVRRGDVPGGIFVRGPAHGVSGYAHMVNRFVRTLTARGIPLNLAGLLGDEAWASPPDVSVRPDHVVHFLTPAVAEPIPGLPGALFSMFEGTCIPPAWKTPSERFDLVVVPSRASQEAWMAGGFPEDRIRICPLGVDAESPAPPIDVIDLAGRSVAGRRCRILNVSDFIPRKNVDGVLRVWLRSTAPDDDAVLILKLGKGKTETRDGVLHLLRRAEEAVGKSRAQAAPIAVIYQALTEEQMTSLFGSATHYFSLSHGEGWDLPMSRAGALGLRLIAPAHSAYLEYLDDTVAHLIPAIPGPAHQPYGREPWAPFFGLDWWEPDEDAAADLLMRIVRGQDHAPQDARSRLLRHFTWDQATDRLLAVLDEVKRG